jgi:glutathionyl-hydroquinone reductase
MADNNKLTQWAGKDGAYNRQVSSFRDHIAEGGPFPPEKGEEHLKYV